MEEELRGALVTSTSIARPVFDPAKPEHLWVAVAVYRMPNQVGSRGKVILDRENLVYLGGPTCFFCLLPPHRAAAQCPGKPNL